MTELSNLNRYEVFLKTAEHGSISKAAEALYISQPAVSAAIKKLEDSLGCTLFLRKSKGVELTENGKELYDRVSAALGSIADAENALKHSLEVSRIRIAASSVLCKYMLMPYLKRFTEKYPETDVSIICTSSAQSEILLRDQKIDVALMSKPQNITGFEYAPLDKIEYVFVCTPAYLEKFGDTDIFENGNILLLNKRNASRIHIDKYYAENNINPQHILEINDMDLLIEFAKIGIGISCVVKQFVKAELESGALTEIKLKAPIPTREAGFFYNENAVPINQNILKLIGI